MNCRVLSHRCASTSAIVRPSPVTALAPKNVSVRAAPRTMLRPVATASFVAPNAAATSSSSATGADPATYPVTDIASQEAFQQVLANSGDKLVVLMCKAMACKPCKVFKPKYGKMATVLSDATFCEVIGDRNDSTKQLMRSQNVRATPTFMFFRNGEKIHQHSGTNATKMVEALKETVKAGEAGHSADFAAVAAAME